MLFILLFGLFSYAQEGIIPIAETCFVSEKSDGKCNRLENAGDSVWRIITYKRNYPFLVNVESKCKLCVFNELYTLTLEEDFLGSCSYIDGSLLVGSNGRNYSQNFKKKVDLLEHLIIEFRKSSSDRKALSPQKYFGREYFVEWMYFFYMDTQRQELKSKIPIYISGFCTDEQLKQAAKLKEEHIRRRKAEITER